MAKKVVKKVSLSTKARNAVKVLVSAGVIASSDAKEMLNKIRKNLI